MSKSNRNFTGTIVAVIILGAILNLLAAVFTGALGGGAVALALALVATSGVNYVVFVAALRQHFKQEAEEELLDEIADETGMPRRFDEVNFK